MKSLKWKPYRGENYDQANTKLLLVGESHYLDEKPESASNAEDPLFTQEVVKSLAISMDPYPSTFFPNVNRLFHLGDSNRAEFWSKVAFFNLIQRPMMSKKDRPSNTDFINGWRAFYEAVNQLKPEVCLFLGSSVSQSMAKGFSGLDDVECDNIRWINKVGRFWFKKSEMRVGPNTITCLFIKHPSAHFSHEKWRQELSNEYSYIFNI